MDDFLEQMLSVSSWVEGIGVSRGPWDATSVGGGTNGGVVESGILQDVPKFSSVPLASLGRQQIGTLDRGLSSHITGEEHSFGGMETEKEQYISEKPGLSPGFERRTIRDTMLSSASLLDTPSQEQEIDHLARKSIDEGVAQAGSEVLLPVTSQVLPSIAGRGSPLLMNNNYEGHGLQKLPAGMSPSPLILPAWRQSHMGGTSPLPKTLMVQGKPDTFPLLGQAVTRDSHMGKRSRDNDETSGSMDPVSTHSQGLQLEQGYGNQMHPGHDPGTAIMNGTTRPRVRARRGQATDPHSIAERNRRERIAERMKALQELVPDANKTDKASMLDEIINYVKFLQMQVKCLSMCRLGGAGAAISLLSDLPAEGGDSILAATLGQVSGAGGPSQDGTIAYAERQVARLMDEDMSAAMQYLQSKGLCLMPISLATAISSNGTKQPSNQVGTSKAMDDGAAESNHQALEVHCPAAILADCNGGIAAGTVIENAAAKAVCKSLTDTIKREDSTAGGGNEKLV